jgi:signal peptidase I
MMKFLKTIKEIIIYILIIIGLIWLAPKALSFALETPHPMAAISSNSMWPALKQGDIIFIKKVSPEDIKVDDIIVWQQEERGFVIHRVIKIKENAIITRGDANTAEDPPVAFEKIVGKMLEFRGNALKIPYLGKITGIVHKVKNLCY